MGCASIKLTDQQSKKLIRQFQLTPIVGEILNNIRKKPAQYIKNIDRDLGNFQGQKYINIKTPKPCQVVQYQTIEGRKAWQQAKRELKNTYSISYPLIKNAVLYQAASQKGEQFRNKELKIKSNRSTNNIPNNQILEQIRLLTGSKAKPGQYAALVGMDFKFRNRNHIQNALISLIIDDGEPRRINRKTLFSQKFKYYGRYVTETQDYVVVVIYLSSENLVMLT